MLFRQNGEPAVRLDQGAFEGIDFSLFRLTTKPTWARWSVKIASDYRARLIET